MGLSQKQLFPWLLRLSPAWSFLYVQPWIKPLHHSKPESPERNSDCSLQETFLAIKCGSSPFSASPQLSPHLVGSHKEEEKKKCPRLLKSPEAQAQWRLQRPHQHRSPAPPSFFPPHWPPSQPLLAGELTWGAPFQSLRNNLLNQGRRRCRPAPSRLFPPFVSAENSRLQAVRGSSSASRGTAGALQAHLTRTSHLGEGPGPPRGAPSFPGSLPLFPAISDGLSPTWASPVTQWGKKGGRGAPPPHPPSGR